MSDKMKEKLQLIDLKKGDSFMDVQLVSRQVPKKLNFGIIGDHVYTITDELEVLVVARDVGNGHGIVMDVVKYNSAVTEENDNPLTDLIFNPMDLGVELEEIEEAIAEKISEDTGFCHHSFSWQIDVSAHLDMEP